MIEKPFDTLNLIFSDDDKKISTFHAESVSYKVASDYLNRSEVVDLIEQVASTLGRKDWLEQYVFLAIKYKIEDYIFSRDRFVKSPENALATPVYQSSVELFAGSIHRLLSKGSFINKLPVFDSDLLGINRKFLEPNSPNSRILATIRDGLDGHFANDLWVFDGSTELLNHVIFLEIGKPNWFNYAKKNELGYFSTRIALLKNYESRRVFKSFDFDKFKIEKTFFENIVSVLVYSIFYWKRLYERFDIRLTLEGEERQFSPFFKKFAGCSYDGVGKIIGIQRSESYFPNKTLGPEITRDIFYSWSTTFESLHLNERFPSKIVLSTSAHNKKIVDSQTEISAGVEKGVRVIVGFDNIYGNLGNPLTERSYDRFIRLFIELLSRHDDINVLIKLKSPRNSLHPIFSSSYELRELVDSGRFRLWEEPRTDILKFKTFGNLFIGMGVSSAISQLGLRGYNAINFDVMGVRSFHPLYNQPYYDVIFDSDAELVSKCGEFLEGKVDRLGHWPESSDESAGQPDCFADVIQQLLIEDKDISD